MYLFGMALLMHGSDARRILIALLIVSCCGCRKKPDCPLNLVSIPVAAGFTGYTAAELREVIIEYMPEGPGSHRFDTLRNPKFFDADSDTLVLSEHFLRRGYGYRISIPAAGTEYQITRLRFNNPQVDATNMPAGCVGGGRTDYMRPDSFDLGGKTTAPVRHTLAMRIVLLRRP